MVVGKEILIEELSRSTGLTLNTCRAMYDSFMGVLAKHMMNGDDIRVTGIGRFRGVTRPPRNCFNPHKKEVFVSTEKRTVKFKLSPILYSTMNRV